jgi:hypothetical protein
MVGAMALGRGVSRGEHGANSNGTPLRATCEASHALPGILRPSPEALLRQKMAGTSHVDEVTRFQDHFAGRLVDHQDPRELKGDLPDHHQDHRAVGPNAEQVSTPTSLIRTALSSAVAVKVTCTDVISCGPTGRSGNMKNLMCPSNEVVTLTPQALVNSTSSNVSEKVMVSVTGLPPAKTAGAKANTNKAVNSESTRSCDNHSFAHTPTCARSAWSRCIDESTP